MKLESIMRLDSDGKLAIKVNEHIYSDLSDDFRRNFREYIIQAYKNHPDLCTDKGIKVDLAEEMSVFCKCTGYNVDIVSTLSNGDSTIEIRELTNTYINKDGELDLDDPYEY